MLRFSCKDSFQFVFAVPCAERPKTKDSFLSLSLDRSVFAALDLIALLLQFLQKIFVAFGLFSQNIGNRNCNQDTEMQKAALAEYSIPILWLNGFARDCRTQ